MRIIPKIYLYDNSQPNNKGVEFSSNILQGYSFNDNLDDTLDTFECTLAGLDFKEEFSPSTKFIIELYNGETLWKEIDMVVDNDTVTQPILADNSYFDHHINFIECGVLAQKRLVDNIAVTYKLKDVSLNILPTYDVNEQVSANFSNVDVSGTFYKSLQTQAFPPRVAFESKIAHEFEWVFPDWYNVVIDGVERTPLDWVQNVGLKYYQQIGEVETSKTITLPLPMLKVFCPSGNYSSSFVLNGFASLDVTVTKTEIATGTQTIVKTQMVNPSRTSSYEAWQSDRNDPTATGEGWIESRPYAYETTDPEMENYGFILSKVAEYVDTYQDRTLTIDIEKGFVYNVNIKMHRFDPKSFAGSNAPSWYINTFYNSLYDIVPRYTGFAQYSTYGDVVINMDSSPTNDAYPSYSVEFAGVLAGTDLSVYISQAPPANAYDLFNKAQLTTQDYIKEQGFTADETPKTFKIDNEPDTQELKDTTIVENFYNQKNLWEIFMDIGKYIHARPIINFGDDDDFIVGWKRYGKTSPSTDINTKISIYNSRFIAEYISACSSYVSNMVQLGGIITEVLPAKSNSEDYLVYNDVAEILTNKNIIEIVELNVIDINPNSSYYKQKRGLTGNDPNVTYLQISNQGNLIDTNQQNTNGFVFEENIYQLLPITPSNNTHKGVAIYYSLGTNNIKGLNYQLPSINRGDFWNNYAIKNIIGTVYKLSPSTWKDVKINDYAFEIKYRTKDTLRVNQTRPDLRKYLLNSKYDKIPLHSQFNNQQDILVDSVKFGNNVYGKLIRTGNTIITENEWTDNISNLKASGDLVLKNLEWYYVAKVSHTFFSDHIISMVEYSKDFNRLSQIIGIPSEPRFYEISEQSLIVREKSINDYIVLGTNPLQRNSLSYIQKNGFNFIKNILFDNNAKYPKYAITIFKDDKDKPIIAGAGLFHKETLHPLSCYSIQNTLTLEWDMADNFSAGDKVIAPSGIYNGAVDQAYNSLEAVKYSNSYGRCDLIDFAIMKDIPQLNETNNSFNPSFVKNLPENNFEIKANQDNYIFGNNEISNFADPITLADGSIEHNPTNVDKGIVLLKDSRECINLNYNLQMITDSDRFVISSYLWQQDKTNIKIALLNEEVSKIINETIPDDIIAVPSIDFTAIVNETDNNIRIRIAEALQNQNLNGIKSIAIYNTGVLNSTEQKASKYFLMARNIDGLTMEEIMQDWYISCYDKNLFNKQ